MHEIVPAFAQAIGQNKWSYHTVTNRDETRSFCQEEVLYSSMNSQILQWIKEALKRSGDGWMESIEYGFFVIETTDGKLTHQYVTSNDHGSIFVEDLDRAFNEIFEGVEPDQINCIQFYHTHPRGPMALTISRSDVDEAIRLQKYSAEKGANVPFHMHAMPCDIAFEGVYEQHKRPLIGKGAVLPPELIPIQPTLLRISVDP